MTARLAGILTLLKDPTATVIELQEYESARMIMEQYFIPHARYAFCGERLISPAADELLKAMTGSMTREFPCVLQSALWEQKRGTKKFPKSGGKAVFEKAIAELASAHLIRPANLQSTAATGRPLGDAWEVHPDILANVPALQPKRTGYELNQYFPQYNSGPRSTAEALEAMQEQNEVDDGLPF